MFESITRAVLAHKQIVIAAIAITGLGMYAGSNSIIAVAQTIIDETFNIPCLPYCNEANEPEDVDVSIPGVLELHLSFEFVPIGSPGGPI
jgi:hypothetical protein